MPVGKTTGEKEKELKDLERAIIRAKNKYKIEGIVTGAVASVYQTSRIQRICNRLGIEVFNPLWQRDQVELLNDLVNNRFEIIIIGHKRIYQFHSIPGLHRVEIKPFFIVNKA